MNPIVCKIAHDVRAWAEAVAKKKKYSSNLTGMCAIVAAELHDQLKRAGVHTVIGVTTDWSIGSHAYVLYGDHVIDVTATQFSELHDTKVVILHEKEAEQYWFYRDTEVYKSRYALREYQIESGWPGDQIAYARTSVRETA